MILKHQDSIETTDKLIQSGNSAEKQMAFYLRKFTACSTIVL